MLKNCAFLLLSSIMEQATNSESSDELVHSHSFAIAFFVLSKKMKISACMGAKCSRKNKQLSLLT